MEYVKKENVSLLEMEMRLEGIEEDCFGIIRDDIYQDIIIENFFIWILEGSIRLYMMEII